MTFNIFHRLAARSRLTKARRAYAIAQAEYDAACGRNDSRRISAAWRVLSAAKNAVLDAERIVYPQQPLARRG